MSKALRSGDLDVKGARRALEAIGRRGCSDLVRALRYLVATRAQVDRLMRKRAEAGRGRRASQYRMMRGEVFALVIETEEKLGPCGPSAQVEDAIYDVFDDLVTEGAREGHANRGAVSRILDVIGARSCDELDKARRRFEGAEELARHISRKRARQKRAREAAEQDALADYWRAQARAVERTLDRKRASGGCGGTREVFARLQVLCRGDTTHTPYDGVHLTIRSPADGATATHTWTFATCERNSGAAAELIDARIKEKLDGGKPLFGPGTSWDLRLGPTAPGAWKIDLVLQG